jgi:hypothetical protein
VKEDLVLLLIVVFKIQSSGISFKWSMQCNKGSFIGRFSDLSVIYKDISAILSRFLHSHFILSPPSSSRAAHLWVRHANTVTDCINWMEVLSNVPYLYGVLSSDCTSYLLILWCGHRFSSSSSSS